MPREYLVSSFYLKIKNRLTFSQILQSAFAKDFFVKKRKVRVPYFFCRKKRACATIFLLERWWYWLRNDWQSWSDFQLNLSWKTEMLDVVTVFINVVGPFHVPSKNYQGNRLLVFDLSIVLTKFSLHISRKNVIRRMGWLRVQHFLHGFI